MYMGAISEHFAIMLRLKEEYFQNKVIKKQMFD